MFAGAEGRTISLPLIFECRGSRSASLDQPERGRFRKAKLAKPTDDLSRLAPSPQCRGWCTVPPIAIAACNSTSSASRCSFTMSRAFRAPIISPLQSRWHLQQPHRSDLVLAVESEWSSVSPVASLAMPHWKINTRAPSSAFLHFVHCIHKAKKPQSS
jgi:hypothetical protein